MNHPSKLMLINKSRHLGGFCCALLITSYSPLTKAHNFSITTAYERWHYQELANSKEVLNKEHGWLPTIQLTGTLQLHQSHFLQFEYAVQQGSLNYHGQTQSGAAHHTQTTTQTQRLHIQWEYQYLRSRFGFGWQEYSWDREIEAKHGVLALYEYYSWRGPIAQAKSFIASQYGTTTLSGYAGWWFEGKLSVDLNPVGYGQATLPLSNGYELGFALKHNIAINNRWSILLAHQQGWRNFSESKEVNISSGLSMHEPKSRNHFHSYGIGLEYSF